MLKQRKLCVLVLLALFGLILQIVVFSSPSWAIFKFPINDDGTLKELGGTLGGYEYPPDFQFNEDECAELSFGLWTVETCALYREDDDYDREKRSMGFHGGHHHWKKKCYENGYKNTERQAENLPKNMEPIKQMNKHIGVTTKLGLTEYQAETVAGLAASVIGLISSIMYARTGAKKGSLGVVCCLCLLTSGVLYWTAIGKIHTTISQLRALILILKMAPVKIPTPWCLIVGGMSATLELLAGIMAMLILSRDNRKDESPSNPQEPEPSSSGILEQAVAPSTSVMEMGLEKKAYVLPEYQAEIEPPPYDAQMSKEEEAGLPADKF